jgi:hypothetical protein
MWLAMYLQKGTTGNWKQSVGHVNSAHIGPVPEPLRPSELWALAAEVVDRPQRIRADVEE